MEARTESLNSAFLAEDEERRRPEGPRKDRRLLFFTGHLNVKTANPPTPAEDENVAALSVLGTILILGVVGDGVPAVGTAGGRLDHGDVGGPLLPPNTPAARGIRNVEGRHWPCPLLDEGLLLRLAILLLIDPYHCLLALPNTHPGQDRLSDRIDIQLARIGDSHRHG